MGCQVEIPEVGGCLKDFLEALPPGTLNRVVEAMDGVLSRISDETLGRVDGAIRGLERKVATLLSERNAVTDKLARLQGIIDAAEQFLRKIDCPELHVLKEMWDDRKRELEERFAAIDTGPVEDALRKHRELKTSLTCQQANARKVTDFVRSFRGDVAMGQPFALFGSPTNHGGTIITASPDVHACGVQLAHCGDKHACPIPGHGVTEIVVCDPKVFANGLGVARICDKAACGATITAGCPTASGAA